MPIDYSRYPPNWKTEIVPVVLLRANHRCEKCELKNGQIVWSIHLQVKDDNGRYKQRSLWFQDMNDALRESNYDSIRKVKVVLTVAHLDHDELNHDVELNRLAALCQICHLRYDAKEKYKRLTEKWNQQKLL